MQIDKQKTSKFKQSLLWANEWCGDHPDGYANYYNDDGSISKQICKLIPYFMQGVAIGLLKIELGRD